MKFANCLRAVALAAMLASATALLAQNNIQVTVNGQPVMFNEARPQMIDGHVLVPLRGVMEQLGAYVHWDPVSHTVSATKAGSAIQLRIGDRSATVNGQTVALDVPAMIIGGSTMVPLRFMGESLGADVRWDANTSTVAINTANAQTAQDVNNYSPPSQTYTPPNQQQYSGNQVVRVNSFMHDATGWVTPQRPAHFSMEGTPGGQAYLYVPGITGEMPMRETRPGHYEADWAPQYSSAPLSIRDAAPVARLSMNGQQQYIQAKSNLQVDTEPPIIRSFDPAPNSTIIARPQITVNVNDAGSGVDPAQTRVLFNGQDVTSQSTISPGYVSYTPSYDLAPGVYNAEVIVTDRAGNVTDKKWNFTATGQSGNPNVLTHTGTGQLLPGQTVTFTMSAPPGSRVSVAIDHKVNVPLVETSRGVFTGSYVIRNRDLFANDPVGARVIPPAGKQYLVQAFKPFGYTTASVTDTVPVITSPRQSDRVSDPLIVQGVAPPNSTVQVHVSYASSLLGAFRVTGAVADVTAFTDENGNFATRPISLSGFANGSNTVYTITAATVLPNGSQSSAATLTVRR